jgi:hypothetical protein
MYELTNKNYQNLPEVKAKTEAVDKKEEIKKRRQQAALFNNVTKQQYLIVSNSLNSKCVKDLKIRKNCNHLYSHIDTRLKYLKRAITHLFIYLLDHLFVINL